MKKKAITLTKSLLLKRKVEKLKNNRKVQFPKVCLELQSEERSGEIQESKLPEILFMTKLRLKNSDQSVRSLPEQQ